MKKLLSILLSIILCASVFNVLGCAQDTKKDVYYSISLTSTAGGTASVDKTSVPLGGTVIVSVNANDGYVVKEFKINGTVAQLTTKTEIIKDGDNVIEKTSTTYVINNILRNYNVSVSFGQANVSVEFKDSEGNELFDTAQTTYGTTFGKLPTPYQVGKRFVCWQDQTGRNIVPSSIVNPTGDKVILTAQFEDITQTEKEKMTPIAISSSYFDQAATKYGVSWITDIVPVNPTVVITDGQEAVELSAQSKEWVNDDYVSLAVIDNLKFNTQYTVKVGDKSADVWSKEYTFKTREENPEDAKFLFLTDTYQSNVSAKNSAYYHTLTEATSRFSNVDFIAHGGNAVSSKLATGEWVESIKSAEEWLFNLPVMAVCGENANTVTNNYTVSYDIMSKLFNIDCPDERYTQHGIYYSFDYGPIHFVSLRSNDVIFLTKMGNHQLDWLKEDLQSARERDGIKWIVVMMNEGPITASYKKGLVPYRQAVLGSALMSIFDSNGVDLVLYGKNGHLGSSYPIVWDANAQNATDQNTYKCVGSLGTPELNGGVSVDTFVYNDSAVRGTIYHQTGNVGQYKFDSNEGYVDVANYRKLLSGYKGVISTNIEYSMYSYVEVSANSLCLKTYGVDVVGLASDLNNATDYGTYLDGFILRK